MITRHEWVTRRGLATRRGFIQILVSLGCGAIASGCQDKASASLARPWVRPTPSGRPAQVARVASGQTIEVLFFDTSSAVNQVVRLAGIQSPDLAQNPWGKEAQAYLEHLVLGKTVLLEFDQQPLDAYERQLAYVWLDDQLINQTLVAEGLVLEGVRSPNLKYESMLKNAQSRARLLGLGIWDPDYPMSQTPSEFRQRQHS